MSSCVPKHLCWERGKTARIRRRGGPISPFRVNFPSLLSSLLPSLPVFAGLIGSKQPSPGGVLWTTDSGKGLSLSTCRLYTLLRQLGTWKQDGQRYQHNQAQESRPLVIF